MSEPTTEAGRRVVEVAPCDGGVSPEALTEMVLAIEAEAVNAVLDRLAAKVRGMPTVSRSLADAVGYRVLAAIEKERR